MNRNSRIAKKLARRKRRIEKRLQAARDTRFVRMMSGAPPMLSSAGLKYELADKTQAIAYGGVPLMLRVAHESGLVDAIDCGVPILKWRCPYYESDHVLNLAMNALCEGTCLEHIERRRNDEAFLNAIGADSIPDPTTEGDFCRRFSAANVRQLLDAINRARLNVWKQQPDEFFDEAFVDMDGTMTVTTGECKGGMDISYKGDWGYHPLVVSLANTSEVLSIVNRSGNRPSEEGAADEADRAITLCRQAGFRCIRLRGDTAFSQTEHLDRWHEAGDVLFQFGYAGKQNLKDLAENLPESAWQTLTRPARYAVKTKPRAKPDNVKRQVVRRRLFEHLELKSEQVAEFEYQPVACRRSYRLVLVRKNISHEKGEQVLFDEIRYFFYITNDRTASTAEIVFGCNDRCDQENLIAQLAGGARALSAPVDSLVSNWAYMVMTSLAWTLKAWSALLLPITPRHRESHEAARKTWLRMEFKTFVNEVLKVPCQIVRQGRRVIHRVLHWNPQLPTFFRLSAALNC
ncbi:MAG: IS1380 family transposase [Planctomycetaceae bacterium]